MLNRKFCASNSPTFHILTVSGNNNPKNTDNLKTKEIIIRESLLNTVLVIFIFSALTLVIFYNFENILFKWEEFNPNGITTIFFLLFLTLSTLNCLKIFDKKPYLKINEKGVWISTSFIPFYPSKFIDWNEVDFVELNKVRYTKYRKGLGIIISKKNSLNTDIIYLENLNYPKEKIITIFKDYSKFLDYANRTEIKNYFR